MIRRTVVVGTGFLGAAVVQFLRRSGMAPLHTYRQRQVFADSVRFDLFRQRLSEVVPISDVGTVIFTARIEDAFDRSNLQSAMESLFRECRNMRIVYLSSDAVFDGQRGMYVESDAPSPLTTYGRNKAACENFWERSHPTHCIIRPSYIFGFSCGQLDPRLAQALTTLRSGIPFHRFNDMYKSPIEVNRLAGIVVQAARSSFGVTSCGWRAHERV
ncbi:MAG: sugar nucleotide-binding protein [Sulfuritalea sp.]|nr:sugar nucleotide-binding protein [Sulfuritalea sp.]